VPSVRKEGHLNLPSRFGRRDEESDVAAHKTWAGKCLLELKAKGVPARLEFLVPKQQSGPTQQIANGVTRWGGWQVGAPARRPSGQQRSFAGFHRLSITRYTFWHLGSGNHGQQLAKTLSNSLQCGMSESLTSGLCGRMSHLYQ
jgi:hypothetical protein